MAGHPDTSDRTHHLVVWGATGFTGRLVVEYLSKRYPPGDELRWAVAGRSREKLERLLEEHGVAGGSVPILVADSHEAGSLQSLARSTRVVLTTVGPYAKYGSELVQACVLHGTHYCDLAGEVQWIRRMIDAHQHAAEHSGACIVHSCGFDSIPSDIGVWFLQKRARELHGTPCPAIALLVKAMRGGASGGTYASSLNAIEEARRDREVARTLVDPYSLNPEGRRDGPDGRDQRGVELNEDLGVWTAPFVMAIINTRIVRRTNALLGFAYGQDFRYSEAVMTGPGVRGRIRAMAMTAGLGAFMFASSFRLTRDLLVRPLLPKPGEGPDRAAREAGFFNLVLVGKLADGTLLHARVKGDRDPGYGSTSKMLAESAVCLALDDTGVGGGVWTPAAAMGDPLLERLTWNAGLSFELE